MISSSHSFQLSITITRLLLLLLRCRLQRTFKKYLKMERCRRTAGELAGSRGPEKCPFCTGTLGKK
jgi:hypothetical protein